MSTTNPTGTTGTTGTSGVTGTTTGPSASIGATGGTSASGESASRNLKDQLGEAGSHLKRAAQDAGSAVRGAAGAAGEELKIGRAHVKADLADGALAGMSAAEQASAAAREQADVLMEKGRDLVDSAAAMIRERPIAAFGTAFATGWIIAKLARGNNR